MTGKIDMSEGSPYQLAQAEHDRRLAADPDHDRSSCVCCCFDCEDLDLGPGFDDGDGPG